MNDSEKEDLRNELLAVLAVRQGNALTAKQALHAVSKEVPFTIPGHEMLAALSFLVGLGHVAKTFGPMGSTAYFEVTSQGVLTYERTKNPNPPRHD